MNRRRLNLMTLRTQNRIDELVEDFLSYWEGLDEIELELPQEDNDAETIPTGTIRVPYQVQ